ncbi:MAG: hypothetical protein EB062_06915 [Actinobacteria bacterium]|nr:hypothetical protein [Actinomycetota bacterium]
MTTLVLQCYVDDCFIADLLVEHITGDETFTFAREKRFQVDVKALQSNTRVVDGGDARSRNENAAPLTARDEP